jgi:hypothetical protein
MKLGAAVDLMPMLAHGALSSGRAIEYSRVIAFVGAAD